ncbi:MAG: endonuclease/exonuclease/phosphatase family protein [Bacteroidales bacterium]|nr:endonuclease/exonuclease/phosphatase family protein [Bacteroidales bacterium]MCF8351415.1 endonuclease/exonuclease/phosphatase family protein [Bacteroidales bacterium]MCF8377222.1 endonuclease/exonuclease/phosphatase family protein [Bacteroidales bacterium]MCF8401093.1 endonuclease/exonuclease/phosphatase family protein [Bacteroidales bacterium]
MRKKTGKAKRSFLKWIMMLINIVAILALILAYLANYINPALWSLPALFGLAYPYILILNLIFVLFWIIFRKYYFLGSLLIIVAGWGFMSRFYQFDSSKAATDDISFKLLSFNVHNLTENNSKKLSDQKNKIFQYVQDQKADITCLQEFFSFGKNYYYPLVFLKEQLGAENYYFQSYFKPSRSKIVGMAIFSKLPRVDRGILCHDSTRKFGIWANFIFREDTFRVYNIHLESLYLSRQDYDLVTGEHIRVDKNRSFLSYSLHIMSKLRKAYRKRSMQVEVVREHIENCSYPVIICGDFNDTPLSYAYHQLSKNLKDAFIESGSGAGKTFRSKLPFFRIDYILHDPDFQSGNFQKEQFEISDHFPVSCKLSFR